jgi:hypothetical protein
MAMSIFGSKEDPRGTESRIALLVSKTYVIE